MISDLEQEFRERIVHREEYNLLVGDSRWTLMFSVGYFRVERQDGASHETFDTLNEAVYYLLTQVGYWRK